MTKEEAIKYLKQLYPNGGHCWLDEQRIEAISMAVKALQEEPVSNDMEEAIDEYAPDFSNDIASKAAVNAIRDAFKAGAKWKEEQMMAKTIDVTVHMDAGGYPYIPQMELYDYDNDIPIAKEGDKYKVVLIKDE